MCKLRDAGVAVYDLGGWHSGHDDQERLQIDAFKEDFGGTVTVEFGWVAGITLIDRLVAWLERLHPWIEGVS